MATYIALINYTAQGISKIKESPQRAEDFIKNAEGMGVKVKNVYWTTGAHDGVLILESPDDKSAVAALLSLSSTGNVKAQTLRAFDSSEIKEILGKI